MTSNSYGIEGSWCGICKCSIVKINYKEKSLLLDNEKVQESFQSQDEIQKDKDFFNYVKNQIHNSENWRLVHEHFCERGY